MKKYNEAVREAGRYRRAIAVFAVVFLVAALINGAEALAPLMEIDDVERVPAVPALVSAQRVATNDDTARTVTKRQLPVDSNSSSEFAGSGSRPFDSQVSRPRSSGIERATHPTGPPPVMA